MYERHNHRVISRRDFAKRVGRHFLLSLGGIAIALSIGVAGYHFIARLDWIDALLNASMILGGMGPVNELCTSGAKLFASLYALFSGLVFVALAGLLVAPFLHRLLHRLHFDEERDL